MSAIATPPGAAGPGAVPLGPPFEQPAPAAASVLRLVEAEVEEPAARSLETSRASWEHKCERRAPSLSPILLSPDPVSTLPAARLLALGVALAPRVLPEQHKCRTAEAGNGVGDRLAGGDLLSKRAWRYIDEALRTLNGHAQPCPMFSASAGVMALPPGAMSDSSSVTRSSSR